MTGEQDIVTLYVVFRAPSKLDDVDRVYVEDETAAGLPPGAPAFEPSA